MREKELLLFDLDGTLIDSSADLIASVNYTLMCLGRERFESETVGRWIGNGAHTLVARALSGSFEVDPALDKKEFEKALAIFLDHYKNNSCVQTTLYAGVEETLEKLAPHFTMAIVTNKPFAFIEPIIVKLGIDGYFSLLLGADSLEEKKPSSMPLLHALKHFGVDKKRSLMIGDSKNDILAAKRAGIESVLLTYGYTQGEDPNELGADIMIKRFGDLERVLLG